MLARDITLALENLLALVRRAELIGNNGHDSIQPFVYRKEDGEEATLTYTRWLSTLRQGHCFCRDNFILRAPQIKFVSISWVAISHIQKPSSHVACCFNIESKQMNKHPPQPKQESPPTTKRTFENCVV